jgi:SAM-dependent methyltransferase
MSSKRMRGITSHPSTAQARPLPWNYPEVVAAAARSCQRMLDMGTGGGEMLLRIPARAAFAVADEAWGPNVPVAAGNLRPAGIAVVQDEGAPDNAEQDGVRGRLPYRTHAFDLVINRHEAFVAAEVFRVLRRGGTFVNQQFDLHSYDDFYLGLGRQIPHEAESWLPLARSQLEGAGFVVSTALTGEEHQSFRRCRRADLVPARGALGDERLRPRCLRARPPARPMSACGKPPSSSASDDCSS